MGIGALVSKEICPSEPKPNNGRTSPDTSLKHVPKPTLFL